MELVRHRAVEAQDGLDRGIAGSSVAGLSPMQLHPLRLEHHTAAAAGIAHRRSIEHERGALDTGGQAAHAGLTEPPVDDRRRRTARLEYFKRGGELADEELGVVDL